MIGHKGGEGMTAVKSVDRKKLDTLSPGARRAVLASIPADAAGDQLDVSKLSHDAVDELFADEIATKGWETRHSCGVTTVYRPASTEKPEEIRARALGGL
jgi:hypothetical protein